MPNDEKVLNVIYEAIDELNAENPDRPAIEKQPGTILFGRGGCLDSLSLVNLIVSVEALLDSVFDVSVTLADEKAMSLSHNPFKTVERLAEYAQGRMAEVKSE